MAAQDVHWQVGMRLAQLFVELDVEGNVYRVPQCATAFVERAQVGFCHLACWLRRELAAYLGRQTSSEGA